MLAKTLVEAITKIALGGEDGSGFMDLKKDLEMFSQLSLKGAIAEAREVKVTLDKTISFAQSAMEMKNTFASPAKTQSKSPALESTGTDSFVDYRKEVDRLMGALLTEGVPMGEILQNYAIFGKTPEMKSLGKDELKYMATQMRRDLESRLAADARIEEALEAESPDRSLKPGTDQYPKPGNSMSPGN